MMGKGWLLLEMFCSYSQERIHFHLQRFKWWLKVSDKVIVIRWLVFFIKKGVYISHRMASCRFCDDIIVFEDGRIVERGSHEALFAVGGRYARMWNAQAKYYNVTDSHPEAPACARS